jgi:hypothetical protein
MPLWRPMGSGIWEIVPICLQSAQLRVLLCVYREHLLALHGSPRKRGQRRTKI